jgi:hypothetical protein
MFKETNHSHPFAVKYGLVIRLAGSVGLLFGANAFVISVASNINCHPAHLAFNNFIGFLSLTLLFKII